MAGLLKTLLIFAFIYYAIKFISPYIKKYAMKKVGEKLEQQMRNQFGGEERSQSQPSNNDGRKEGDIRVEKNASQTTNPSSKHKKYNTKNIGEYVDYEDVSD